MSILSFTVLGIHFFLLAILCLFGLHRLSMVFRWWYHRHAKPRVSERFDTLPAITVQVPLYNERFVAERVVDAVASLHYPRHLLHIQIVDDSTDDTSEIIAARVAGHRRSGVDIDHVRRTNRHGFKAGALADALEHAKGEFIAVFDADFLPSKDLLLDTIDHFTNPEIGMVQFRWEHLNRDNSPLTKTQAMALDAHFALEQKVRCASDLFFNFNGTAGVWRKRAIYDAGNWSDDTLTEDLDLSYRAQLRGWRMLYLNHVSCAGELPADIAAFKSQQHRWAKGAIEVMLKSLRHVWRSPFSLRHKVESTFHLSNNLAYLIMMIDAVVFLVPSLVIREQYNLSQTLWLDLPMAIMSTGGHMLYFITGQIALGYSIWRSLSHVPRLLLLGIQLALNNAFAAGEALVGHRTGFVRTPKRGDNETRQRTKRFYQAIKPRGAMTELLLGVVFCLVFLWALSQGLWYGLPFLLLLAVGFSLTGVSSLRVSFSSNS